MEAGNPRSRGYSLPHAIGLAVLTMAVMAFCASCNETYPSATKRGLLSEEREEQSSVVFAMNGRPVRLELCIRLEGNGAVVELDHPDGRTTETIQVSGPGIRELCKEFPKEPGSWGLRLRSTGGNAAYWISLHDRKKYIGPDEDSRRFVERE